MTVTTTYQLRNLTEISLNYSIVDLTSTIQGGFDAAVLSETSNSQYWLAGGGWADSLNFRLPQTGTDPHIAALSNGSTVVVAQTSGGIGVGYGKIVMGTAGDTAPDVAALVGPRPGGGIWNSTSDYVVVDQHPVSTGNNDIQVHVRHPQRLGAPSTDVDFTVDATTADDRAPVVAGLADGGFAVAWERHVGTSIEAWSAVYNYDGSVRRAPAAFDSAGPSNQNLSITALKNGGFAIYYADSQAGSPDVETSSIALFDASGTLQNTLHTPVNGPQETGQDIAQLENGYLVTINTDTSEMFRNTTQVSLVDPVTGTTVLTRLIGSNHDSVFATAFTGMPGGQFITAYAYGEEDGGAGREYARYQFERTSVGDAADDTIKGDELVDIEHGGDGNDYLIGGASGDTLYGEGGNDQLSGGLGADAMYGGDGDDIYVVDSAGDMVSELADQGIDRVKSSVSYTLGDNVEDLTLLGTDPLEGTGNGLDNRITGNAGVNTLSGLDGDDWLDGAAGADRLVGGEGNDTFVVDDSLEKTIELADEGIDTVRTAIAFKLQANVENLQLLGTGNVNITGNALDNAMSGNSGNNVIDGGAGADTMKGGAGDDTYVVDNAGDVVIEGVTHGFDTVKSSISYTLSNNVEALILTGSANLDGTGNGLGNAITGNSGNNAIDGAAGADTMKGGAGDDTYMVDNAGDAVIEAVNQGTDLVIAKASFTLAANVENLTLTGNGTVDGTGNSLANTLIGNARTNGLDGKAGNDILTGGAGRDTFVFSTALNAATNLDTITDYQSGFDHIALSHATFAALAVGNLAATAFAQAVAAMTSDQHIVYNQASGVVSYDTDGSGAAAAVAFAKVTPGQSLTYHDFSVT